jgi:hypothetical protein
LNLILFLIYSTIFKENIGGNNNLVIPVIFGERGVENMTLPRG